MTEEVERWLIEYYGLRDEIEFLNANMELDNPQIQENLCKMIDMLVHEGKVIAKEYKRPDMEYPITEEDINDTIESIEEMKIYVTSSELRKSLSDSKRRIELLFKVLPPQIAQRYV
jgi:hypothetical protein